MNPRRLELDYIARPRPSRAAGAAVLVSALALALVLAGRYHDVRIELERIDAARELGVERRPARAASRERLEEEAKSAEAVLRQLALPWSAILSTVEAAATPDVAVLQMQPDARQRQLRLGAEARDAQAMLEYLRQLAAAKTLAEVHVVSHQVQVEDPQRPVQFTVQASMKGLP